MVLVHAALPLQLLFRHSSVVHIVPSPVKPKSHVHVKLPSVLLHAALPSQDLFKIVRAS